MDKNNITFFPAPYPDELFYGLVSRYKVWSGIIDNKTVLRELYNTTNIIAGRLLPANFKLFYENIPIDYKVNVEEIIKSNTAYKFYTAFVINNIAEVVYKNMFNSNGSQIYNLLGLCNNRIKPSNILKYCTKCIDEDRNLYGEAYWHLEHQLDGVLICRKHKKILRVLNKSKNRINRQKYFNLEIEQDINEDREIQELDVREIELQVSYCNNVYKVLSSDYKHFNMNEIREIYLQQLIKNNIANNRMDLNQDVLLKSFVGFYGADYLRKIGAEVEINNKNNWVTSIVRKHRTFFHPMQHLLLMQFLELDSDELFSSLIVDNHKLYKQKSIEEVRKYRAKWTDLLNEHPSYNTTNLRRLDIATYTWLYKYDNSWFKGRLPKRKVGGNNSNIDWNQRDLEVLEAVKKAITEILEYEGKPERVSIGAIGRRIGRPYLLQKKLDKLKKTKEFLGGNIESVEQFQKRRYKRVEERHPELMEWEKRRKVGLR